MDAVIAARQTELLARTKADERRAPLLPEQEGPHNRCSDECPPTFWFKGLKLFTSLALILAIVAAAVELTWLVFDLQHKSYGEGPILAMSERMRSEPISASWMREPPYTLSCYGPAYYWLTNVVAWAGGWHLSFVPGRMIAVISTLVIAALLALTAGRATKNAQIGLTAALIFLVSLPVNDWVPHARVDMLALVFAAAAYLSISVNPCKVLLPAALIAAGSLAKPTIAFSAVPICAHLVAHRRYRETAIFSALVAVLGAAAWLVVQRISDGFFLTAVLTGNRNPMHLWHGYFFTYLFLVCPLAVAALLVTGSTLIVSPQRFFRSLFSLGFAMSLAISAVAVCKRGAELNYFLEPTMLGCLAIAVDGIPLLWQAGPRRCLAGMTALAALVGLPNVREIKSHLRTPLPQPAAYETVRSALAGEPEDVGILADGRQVDMVMKTGHQAWVNDSYLYSLLVQNGTLDSSPLIERLQDGRIRWLVFRKTLDDHREAIGFDTHCWPIEAIDVMPKYYELVTAENGIWVYRHRKVAATLRGGEGGRTTTAPWSDLPRSLPCITTQLRRPRQVAPRTPPRSAGVTSRRVTPSGRPASLQPHHDLLLFNHTTTSNQQPASPNQRTAPWPKTTVALKTISQRNA
ncbi:MAG TPA: hypothetical protein VG125_26935 [Pirellulales bacterium]|jgi:hypothetical protein|nr:hypothetical protein [Pirellulales bacterium]